MVRMLTVVGSVLMGAAEIAEYLGVSRQRVQQLAARPDFPAEADTLTMGRVWYREDVEKWNAKRTRPLPTD